MAKPMFSVIVTVYNREKEIGSALGSLLNQTCDNFEVIIVDDNSTDKSVSEIESFLHKSSKLNAKLVKRTENGGQNAAINSALPFLRGLFVAFLDSDDEWMPNFLETFRMHFEELNGQEFDFHYCRFVEGPKWSLEGSNQFQNVLKQGYLSALGTLVVKLEAFKSILPLPERLFVNDMCQDDFISFELSRRFSFSHLPQELYRVNSNNLNRITQNNQNYIIGWLQFYRFYKQEIVHELGWQIYVRHLSRVFTDFLSRGDIKVWFSYIIKQFDELGLFRFTYFIFILTKNVFKLLRTHLLSKFRVNE